MVGLFFFFVVFFVFNVDRTFVDAIDLFGFCVCFLFCFVEVTYLYSSKLFLINRKQYQQIILSCGVCKCSVSFVVSRKHSQLTLNCLSVISIENKHFLKLISVC